MNRYFKQLTALSLRQKLDVCIALYRLVFTIAQIKLRSIDWFWKKSIDDHPMLVDVELSSDVMVQNIQIATDLHESIRLASRLLPFTCDCLPRSLVLRDMLQKRGIAAKIQIGVQKTNMSLQSHAWVEVCGEEIGEKEGLKSNFKPIGDKN